MGDQIGLRNFFPIAKNERTVILPLGNLGEEIAAMLDGELTGHPSGCGGVVRVFVHAVCEKCDNDLVLTRQNQNLVFLW